jgi:hypothetical protein
VNVRFCPECHSLILSEFRYCPYCGIEATRGPDLAEALETPFSRLSRSHPGSQGGEASRRIADLAGRIDCLENDMELLMEDLDREKRV